MDYASILCATDEPLIFQYGGKLMRQYLNESGLDDEGKDYEIRAVCKNLVTNSTFHIVFKLAREQVYANDPVWLWDAMRHRQIRKAEYIHYPFGAVHCIKLMQQVGTGFLSLFATGLASVQE